MLRAIFVVGTVHSQRPQPLHLKEFRENLSDANGPSDSAGAVRRFFRSAYKTLSPSRLTHQLRQDYREPTLRSRFLRSGTVFPASSRPGEHAPIPEAPDWK